jgi:D-glycero-D-manno-heptose 1,7-bisphosphate phosphatase
MQLCFKPTLKQVPMKKAFFFDRDGIINESPGPGYVRNWNEFHFIPAFSDVLRTVQAAGYEAVIVSNQRGVARGLMTRSDLDDIHRRLSDLLQTRYKLSLLDIYVCTHENGQCECRKPKPGMILDAAARHKISLPDSWMVGDKPHDIEAGRAAGCRTILVSPAGSAQDADYTVSSMQELHSLVAKIILAG